MNEIKEYIEEVLGLSIQITKMNETKELPFFIAKGFNFFRGQLFTQEFLWLIPKSDEYIDVNGIEKLNLQIDKKFHLPMIMVLEQLPATTRNKLIKKRINFVVPFKQLYLPTLFLDLSETLENKPRRNRRSEMLIPSAQVILMYHLIRHKIEEHPYKELAMVLGYSSMAITKAAANLQQLELAKIIGTKEKYIQFNYEGAELWNTAIQFMIDPVLKRVFIDELPLGISFIRAGESALPQYTDMNPSRQEYVAIEKGMFYALKRDNKLKHLNEWEGRYCVEVWKYNPTTLAAAAYEEAVDPLSLYLTLRKTNDERIEMELEKLIDQHAW